MPQTSQHKSMNSLLIGDNNSDRFDSKFSNKLIGRKNNNVSNLLAGRLSDKDKDGYPNIMDCEPNNPKKHGIIKKVVTAVKTTVSKVTGKNDPGYGGDSGTGFTSTTYSTPKPTPTVQYSQPIGPTRPSSPSTQGGSSSGGGVSSSSSGSSPTTPLSRTSTGSSLPSQNALSSKVNNQPSSIQKASVIQTNVQNTQQRQQSVIIQQKQQEQVRQQLLRKVEEQRRVEQERRRYEELGYNQRQSKVLAQESLKRGGMTFSPEQSEKFINSRVVNQRRENGQYNVPFSRPTSNSVGMENRNTSSDSVVGFSNLFKERKKQREEQRQQFYSSIGPAPSPREFADSQKISVWQGLKRTYWNIKDKGITSSGTFNPLTTQTGSLKADQPVIVLNNGEVVDASRYTKSQIKQLEKSGLGKYMTLEEFNTAKLTKESPELKPYVDIQNERAAYDKLAQDISRDLNKKYQSQIDSGEIGYEQAVTQLNNEFATTYDAKSKELQKAYSEYGGLYKRSGTAGKALLFGSELALMSNPLTGSMLGAGKGQSAEEEFTVIKVDDASKGLPLYPDVKPNAKMKEANLIIGTSALPIFSKIKNVERQLAREELEELGKQPVRYGSLLFKGPEQEGDTVVVKGVQKYKGLKNEIDVIGKVYKEGDKLTVMPMGVAEVRTTGQLSYSVGGNSKVLGISESLVGSRNVQLGGDDKVSYFISREVVQPQMQTGALYNNLKVNRGFEFPTGRVIEQPSEDFFSITRQLPRNVKTGGNTIINIQPSKSIKVNDKLYYGQTTKGDKGFIRIIDENEGNIRVFMNKEPYETGIGEYIVGTRGKVNFPTGDIVEEPLKVSLSRTRNPSKTPFSFTFTDEAVNKETPLSNNLVAEVKEQVIPKRQAPTISARTMKAIGKQSTKAFDSALKQRGLSSAESFIPKSARIGSTYDRVKSSSKSSPVSPTVLNTNELSKVKESQNTPITPKSFSGPSQMPSQGTGLAIVPRQDSSQVTKQDSSSGLGASSIQPTNPRPIIPTTGVPIRPFTLFPGEKRGSFSEEQAYNVYVLRDSTKGKRRYEQINERPLTQESALSMGAEEVDNSISARFKLEKVRDKVEKIRNTAGKIIGERKVKPKAVDTGDRYFEVVNNKFRQYKVNKGNKRPLPSGVFIEKSKYRADSPQEVQTLKQGRRQSSVSRFFGF